MLALGVDHRRRGLLLEWIYRAARCCIDDLGLDYDFYQCLFDGAH